MKNSIVLAFVGMLLFSPAFANNFDFQIVPSRACFDGSKRYEVGSNLTLTARITASQDLGVKAIVAKLGNGRDLQGYPTANMQETRAQSIIGNWAALNMLTIDPITGYVNFQKSNGGNVGATFGANGNNMYFVDFNLTNIGDNLAINFNNSNMVTDASGTTYRFQDANSPLNQANFTFNIMAAASPLGFAGPNSITSSNRGNKLTVNWRSLSNRIGEADLTPPIKYDIYRSTDADFNDPNHVVKVSENYLPSNDIVNYRGTDIGTDDLTVSDGQIYYYKMVAKDSTTASNATGQLPAANPPSGISSDITPPEFPANSKVIAAAGNNAINVSWPGANNPDNDLAGYLVLRREAVLPTGIPDSARDNVNGKDYGEGVDIGDGLVVYKGPNTNFADQRNLVNGTRYFYKVFAYDTATAYDNLGAAINQQGRNYSVRPISNSDAVVTGTPPDRVQKPMALAGPQAGEVTLKWTNPLPLNNYGGALIVYTTDFNNWGAITKDGGNSFTLIDAAIPAPPTNDKESTKTITGLDPQNIYYFKIFPYNIVPNNDVNTRAVQNDGMMVAAIPAALAGAQNPAPQAAPTEINFGPFVKKENKLGIFNFVLPFEPVENGNALKISELVNKVNGNAKVVSSISYWDTANQKVVAYMYDKDGNIAFKKGTDANPQEINISPFMGYQIQINATSNERFTLRSR